MQVLEAASIPEQRPSLDRSFPLGNIAWQVSFASVRWGAGVLGSMLCVPGQCVHAEVTSRGLRIGGIDFGAGGGV